MTPWPVTPVHYSPPQVMTRHPGLRAGVHARFAGGEPAGPGASAEFPFSNLIRLPINEFVKPVY